MARRLATKNARRKQSRKQKTKPVKRQVSKHPIETMQAPKEARNIVSKGKECLH